MSGAGRLTDVPRSVLMLLLMAGGAAWHYLQSGQGVSAGVGILTALLAARVVRDSRPPDRVRLRMTVAGQAVMAVAAVGFAMGRVDVLVTALVVLAVGALTAARGVRAVEVAANPPATATVGQQTTMEVRVTGARGAVEVCLLDPQGDRVLVDGTATGMIRHTAEHRGVFHLVRSMVRSRGWLGVYVGGRLVSTLLDRPIQVLPRPRRTAGMPPLVDATIGQDGRSAAARGQLGLPRGVRAYAPGDARHHVHWPSTARSGSLVVTELDVPTRPTVVVVVELPDPPEVVLASDVAAWQATIDDLTGQALFGIGDLLGRGIPVRLVTIEAADLSIDAPDAQVTDLVPDLRVAAVRLARARPGPARHLVQPTDEPTWVVAVDPDDDASAGETDAEPGDARHAAHAAGVRDVASGLSWAHGAVIGLLLVLGRDDFPLALTLFLPLVVGVGVFHLGTRVWPRLVEVAVIALAALPLLVAWGRPTARMAWVLPAAVAWLAVRMLAERRERVLAAWCHRSRVPPWTRSLAVPAVAGAWLVSAVVPRTSLVVTLAVAATVCGLAVLLGGQVERTARVDARPSAPDRVRQVGRWVVLVAVLVALLPLGQAVRDRWSPRSGLAGQGDPGPADAGAVAATTGVEPWVYGMDRVDGQTRPGGSDAEVLWVATDRPMLLRGQTFDTFDGRAWTQSWFIDDVPTREVAPPGAPTIQEVTIRAEAARVLPAAPVVDDITLPRPDAAAARIGDDGMYADPPLRRGDTYTVASVLPQATPASLRAATAPVPADVRARYVQPPPLSARAAALIDETAAHLPTAYDQVQALQAMLGERVTYSLDAPLPPAGADVVDHFLFEARAGWCEQIASTLTAAMRHLGAPARLVTGFAPGEWDAAAGHFVVRARDAHAWVEVYFPGVGWQGFDPTAEVPLTGEVSAPPPRTPMGAVWLGMAGAIVLLATVGAAAAVRRRGHPREVPAEPSWAERADARLRQLGDDAGVPRRATEGVAGHGRRLARVLQDPRIAQAARGIERAAYGPAPLDEEERNTVDACLAAREHAARA